MATTGEIRKGLCIEYNGDIFQIVDFQHVKPGKGGAFVRTKMKSLTTGRVLENTFNSGASIDTVRVETRTYQFLYKDDTGYHFMNNDTFEQITLQEEMVSAPHLLKEGQEVTVTVHAGDERILSCSLPLYVNLEVTYAEPGIRGDTATNTLKPAK